jgi:Ni/Fe-hydrogenase subunit HybB-like protein
MTAACRPIDRPWLKPAAGFLALAGAAVFVAGVSGAAPERAWQAYLVNFVFWTGLACGSLLFSVVLTITNARWGRPLKRIAEAPGAFLPVSFVLFWVLYLGKGKIFPWITHPVPEKAAWLNVPFLFARNGLGLFCLAAVGLAIIYHSVKRDQEAMAGSPLDLGETREGDERQGNEPHGGERHQVQRNGEQRHGRALSVLSIVYGILYAFILTLIAFDLIMSLSPHWYSTLFGAYYFMGSFYAGLAALMILAGLCVKTTGMGRFIRPLQFHNLGKLMTGFCLVTGDFFFTQFLVIWYGNLPEETHFVITRVRQATWAPLAWTVLIACYVFPFAVLLSRKIKTKLGPMLALSTLILSGIWLERLLLVAPSLWTADHLPLGMIEVAVTAGFLGLMTLCVILFLERFPVLPVGDPLFWELMSRDSEQVE